MKQALSQYEIDADQFLTDANTEFSIQYLYTGKYFADDKEERDIYQFTLKNDKGAYSSKFGDSINDTLYNEYISGKPLNYKQDFDFCESNGIRIMQERVMPGQKKRAPSSYDVLACMNSYLPETFEEFCDEYGYNDMPLSKHDDVMQIFLNCRAESRALNKMFTPEQLEQLAEIA